MPRQVIGTNKFIVYFYNASDVRRRSISRPKNFVYRQWGTIQEISHNNRPIGVSRQFKDYGQMLTIINNIMRRDTIRNLKRNHTW